MEEYDRNLKGLKEEKVNRDKKEKRKKAKWEEEKGGKKRNLVRGQFDRSATVAKSNRGARHFSAFFPLHLPSAHS